MDWRWWGICVLILVPLIAASCRKTVDPNTDRNRPPETFLTAAPLDSIAGGRLNRVPYRYHAHWSGADIDGEVVGFFVAVTETLPGARIPPPKPQDYRFTARTDSVFTFTIHEGLGTDREHGLYVFAVDNQGKVDPTPAFVHFVARDQNLPGVIWEEARAEGRIFVPAPGGGVIEQPFNRVLTDGVDPIGALFQPIDTIPVGAAVFFRWRGFDNDWNGRVTGFRYKLFEPEFVQVDSTVRSVEYATGVGGATAPLPVGLNVFRVRAVDEAGGTTFPDSLRRFAVNFDPDSWWAGPDTTDPEIAAAIRRDARGRYLLAADNITGPPPAVLNRWLSAERFDVMPTERKPMKTFLEKVKIGPEIRYYIRSDGDTVARNAESLFLFAGGRDKDSPYAVIIDPTNVPTEVQGKRVAQPGPANGSPIGFEFRQTRRFVDGSRNNPSFSEIHPSFDPLRAGFRPDLHFVQTRFETGEVFAQLRAVDGNSGKDRRIGDAEKFIRTFPPDPSPKLAALRTLVFTWVNNYNPTLLPTVPSFVPRSDTLITDPNFEGKLFMFDPDSTSGFARAPFVVRVRFRTPATPTDRVTDWQPQEGFRMSTGEAFPIVIPTSLTPGRNFFEFELSDLPGTDLVDRRVVLAQIPFYWQVVE